MKTRMRIGAILMVLGFVFLGLFIILPAIVPFDSSPLFKGALQAVLCNPGDTLSETSSEYDTPTSQTTTTDMSCQPPDGQPYSANGKGIMLGLFGFLVPFLIGTGMVSTASKQQTKMLLTPVDTQYTHTSNHHTQSVSAGQPNRNSPSPVGRSTTLTQELGELKTAMEEGLITQAEYAAKRKDILNRL